MKFENTLHVGSPNIGSRKQFHKYVDEIFDRRWLTNRGECVQELERRLADYLGVEHCICMCNGTIALEIAIRALDLTGEVIVPSLTFVATAHALQWQQIKPVFCDIDRETYNIDPKEVEKHITSNTTGILGVHLYSRPCNINALQKVADKYRLKLLFDAAHAFGCSYGGRMIGNFGECEVFSFHATKFFNTFEGGAIATNNHLLAKKIRLMKNFGFAGMANVVHIGINGKMNELCAAMGLVNIEELGHFIAANKSNYLRYKEKIGKIKGLRLIEYNELEKCNWQYIVIEVEDDYPVSRDQLMSIFHENNVRVRRYFWPGCHRMKPYDEQQPDTGLNLSVTETVADRLLVLPTGINLNGEDINNICRLCCL